MATFGIDGRALPGGSPGWLLIATELGLAAGVIAGSETAAWLAAALMAGFRRDHGRRDPARPRRARRAPASALGRPSAGPAVARNALLAAAFAALPALPEGDLSTDEWLGLGLAVALLACAGLAVAVLALAREVGMLRLRLGPEAALEIAEEGPELFSRTRLAERFSLDPEADPGARRLRLRRAVASATRSSPRSRRSRRTRWSRSRASSEQAEAELWRELGIPGSPFAIAARSRRARCSPRGPSTTSPSSRACSRRPSAAGPSASSRGSSVSETAGRRGASAGRSTRSRPTARGAASSPGSAARSPRSPPAAWSPRRSSRARPRAFTSAATSTRPAPACTRPACRGSTATATRCTPRTGPASTTSAGPSTPAGSPVGTDGKVLRDPDGRPLPPAPRTKVCERDRRATTASPPHIDGGWYRCCGGSVRKLVDCCSTSNTRINGDQALEGYCYRGPQGLLRHVLPDQGAVLSR